MNMLLAKVGLFREKISSSTSRSVQDLQGRIVFSSICQSNDCKSSGVKLNCFGDLYLKLFFFIKFFVFMML